MAVKGKTIFDKKWPTTSIFSGIAKEWKQDAINSMMEYIWNAYDLLKYEVIKDIEKVEDDDEIERSITQLLEPRIHRVMSGDEPFYVQHEVYEYETRINPPAQSPQYDIAFILQSNPRIMWPLEAKTLRTDGRIAEYITDLKEEFLKCRYAPFSNGGAMIGYLLSGSPNNVFKHIQKKMPCTLKRSHRFLKRAHRFSEHKRKVPNGKKYSKNFRCEHLILSFF